MLAKLQILASRHFDFEENSKNHLPKGIFQWNWAHNRSLRIHLHDWNKKKWTFLLLWDLRGKTIFRRPPPPQKKLIYAN